MANPAHVEELKKGGWSWTAWRATNPEIKPDLSWADLSGIKLISVNLSETDFLEAKLVGASLAESNLYFARFYKAKLSQVNLANTNLMRANFTQADLAGANFREASLQNAIFAGANLNGADFTGAKTSFTCFDQLDMRTVTGLETIEHLGPSSIGIDTIYRSAGKIPHAFLRGAGVPDNFITYAASLAGTGIEFYSLFISFSTKDQGFAERLHADLQANGVRCWYSPEDMAGGKKLYEEIDSAIRMHDKLLLILSEHSMKSEWVKTEIAKVRKREIKEGKQILFPIRLCGVDALRDWECFDADTGKDSAREIREYFIPDFSNWKDHDSYQAAFKKLLKDLRGKSDSHSS
jgi:hypothetical protein